MAWSDDAAKNRAAWTKSNAEYTDAAPGTRGRRRNSTGACGTFPSRPSDVLGDVDGLDVVELGCGTAYFSAWLAKRGARPVGVDVTPAQLETARRLQRETGLEFPLVEADAGATGLSDASFDLVVSEYGASIWVDPYRWVPEAARLLRTGGRLVFLRNSTLVVLCYPDDENASATDRLQRPQRGLHRLEWASEGVEFHLGHGEWIDLLHSNGFELERLARALRGGRRARASLLHVARRRVGAAAGRPRRSGWPGRGRERAACAADSAGVDLAAAAGDPHAARRPVRGRRARLRRGARGRPARARGRQGAFGRRRRAAGTRGRHDRHLRRRADRQAARRHRRPAHARDALGRHARGRLGPVPAHGGLGGTPP